MPPHGHHGRHGHRRWGPRFVPGPYSYGPVVYDYPVQATVLDPSVQQRQLAWTIANMVAAAGRQRLSPVFWSKVDASLAAAGLARQQLTNGAVQIVEARTGQVLAQAGP